MMIKGVFELLYASHNALLTVRFILQKSMAPQVRAVTGHNISLLDTDKDYCYIPTIAGPITAGDFILLKGSYRPRRRAVDEEQHGKLPHTRLLQFLRFEKKEEEDNPSLVCQVLCRAQEVPKDIRLLSFPAPVGRQYIDYPEEVVHLNRTILVSVEEVADVAHVFTPDQINSTDAAKCNGMGNAFLYRGAVFLQHKRVLELSQLRRAAHSKHSYSNSILCFLICLVDTIHDVMHKTSYAAGNYGRKTTPCTSSQFDYIIDHLNFGVLSLRAPGIRTFEVPCKNGRREVLRIRNQKVLYRINRKRALDELEHLLGYSVSYCHRTRWDKFSPNKHPKLGKTLFMQQPIMNDDEVTVLDLLANNNDDDS